MKNNKCSMVEDHFSKHNSYCSGYLDNPNGFNVVLPYLGIASVKKHNFSQKLDEIVAFDAAQSSFANAGKINAVKVSSFIGPKSRLAGYDFLRPKCRLIGKVRNIEIYDLNPLLDVTSSILGSVNKPQYPLFPGSIVPCAMESFYCDEAGKKIYSALAITVSKNREKDPILLMEDVGIMQEGFLDYSKKAARASLQVCRIQNIDVDKIYIARKSAAVGKGEIACSLVMCLYVHLAGNLKKEVLTSGNRI